MPNMKDWTPDQRAEAVRKSKETRDRKRATKEMKVLVLRGGIEIEVTDEMYAAHERIMILADEVMNPPGEDQHEELV